MGIGLIERAASLLRDSEPERFETSATSYPTSVEGVPGKTVSPGGLDISTSQILDVRRLAISGIVPASEGRSRIIEEFRLIKQKLISTAFNEAGHADQPLCRLIMVASARQGEGKTFVATNLALAFACEADTEALLIDTDALHPAVLSLFGVMPKEGIFDVLAGDVELSNVLLRTTLPGLTILPSGRSGPHVPELFSSNRMRRLLAELAGRHANRFVIIDTPPCLVSSDAAALAPLVGQIAFVVEAHRTQQQEIETSLGLLSGCSRINFLLNKSDLSTGHFGAGNYHNYEQAKSDELRAVSQT